LSCPLSAGLFTDPESLDKDYLHKADVGLERMEKLAGGILHEIKRGQA